MPPKRAALSLDDELEELKVSELQELCEQNKLEKDGKKSELIERLEQHRKDRKGKRRCRAGPSEESPIGIGNGSKRRGGLDSADSEAQISRLKSDIDDLYKRNSVLSRSHGLLAAQVDFLREMVGLRMPTGWPVLPLSFEDWADHGEQPLFPPGGRPIVPGGL